MAEFKDACFVALPAFPMSTPAGTQGLRLRKPQSALSSSTAPKARPQDEALLKDAVRKYVLPRKCRSELRLTPVLRRTARRPWAPGFSVAFRMLILIRTCAAMYSNIQDCDEGGTEA